MTRSIAAGLALSLLSAMPAPAQEAGIRSAPYIAVQGEAETKAKPELAKLTVMVQTRGDTLDAAIRAHAPRVGKAHEALSDPKLKAANVEQGSFTASVEQEPRIPDARDRRTPFLPAVATTRFSLEIEPVEAVPDVIDALAGTGVLEIRQVAYALRDTKVESRKARAAAMRDAAEQAQVYAEAGGFRLVEIVAVQDGNVRTETGEQADLPVRAMAMGAPRMRSAPPSTIDTRATVSVTWRIAGPDAEKPREAR